MRHALKIHMSDLTCAVWDNDLTRQLVRQRYGADQLQTLRPLLRAVSARLAHAQLHFHDFHQIVQAHLNEPVQQGLTCWDLWDTTEDQNIGANNHFFIACEAYVYATVQALHAIGDNLAHVVYYCLGWNTDGTEGTPPLQSVCLWSVLNRLKQLRLQRPDLLDICAVLDKLSASAEYKVLSNLANHLKHHGGLPVVVKWQPADGSPYLLVLDSYMRNRKPQPQQDISAMLKDTFATMNRAVVEVGCALNDWLQREAQ